MADLDFDRAAGALESVVILGANYLRPESAERLSTYRREGITLVALGAPADSGSFDRIIADETDTDAVLNVLSELQARGTRSYVRFGDHIASIATFSFAAGGKHYAGMIHDISTAGFSCSFRPEPEAVPDSFIERMQLNLPGHTLVFGGQFSAHRVFAGQSVHIFLFTDDVELDIKECIQDFIYRSLEMKLALQ